MLMMITLEEADEELAFVDTDFATGLIDWEHEPIDGEAMDGSGKLNAEQQGAVSELRCHLVNAQAGQLSLERDVYLDDVVVVEEGEGRDAFDWLLTCCLDMRRYLRRC